MAQCAHPRILAFDRSNLLGGRCPKCVLGPLQVCPLGLRRSDLAGVDLQQHDSQGVGGAFQLFGVHYPTGFHGMLRGMGFGIPGASGGGAWNVCCAGTGATTAGAGAAGAITTG